MGQKHLRTFQRQVKQWRLQHGPDKEVFFSVRGPVRGTTDIALLHGRSGKLRFDLPPEPLLPRWLTELRQLLQKRYQL